MLTRRWDWFEAQPELEPARLVFIDETWASTNMARTHGRAPRGQRLRAAIPHGHWKTTTFVAGLRTSGMVAPMVLDGPINSVAFQAYVDQVLVPELRSGDIVVMDIRHNCLIHDSVFTGCLGSVRFPPFGALPPGPHIGENSFLRFVANG